MTSSLVGSEMCIRDRPFNRLPPHPALGPRIFGRAVRTLDACAPDSGVTVSYTHLTLPTICSV
eukprot:7061331-Prorocentrum_lima.AAC.1